LTFSINPQTIVVDTAVGISILMILLSFRTIATTISTRGSDFQKDRRKIILMCAQGLTPATLAIVAVDAGLPLGDTFLELVTYVIILTNVVTHGRFNMDRKKRKAGIPCTRSIRCGCLSARFLINLLENHRMEYK